MYSTTEADTHPKTKKRFFFRLHTLHALADIAGRRVLLRRQPAGRSKDERLGADRGGNPGDRSNRPTRAPCPRFALTASMRRNGPRSRRWDVADNNNAKGGMRGVAVRTRSYARRPAGGPGRSCRVSCVIRACGPNSEWLHNVCRQYCLSEDTTLTQPYAVRFIL
jgi:hypothetical protein